MRDQRHRQRERDAKTKMKTKASSIRKRAGSCQIIKIVKRS